MHVTQQCGHSIDLIRLVDSPAIVAFQADRVDKHHSVFRWDIGSKAKPYLIIEVSSMISKVFGMEDYLNLSTIL